VIQYYFLGADMATHAKDKTPPAAAFQVLKGAAEGTKPLMAVMYQPLENHVELASARSGTSARRIKARGRSGTSSGPGSPSR